MQIVVLASQKGGSGKTTLSGHLAVEAERKGFGPVVLIDTDPQGSLSDWWNARASETPAFARVAIDDLAECLARLEEMGVKLAVIDTPPAITHSIARVVAHADLVVIPARPSPHDLRAVGATIDIVEHFQKPLIFVINAATARAKITGESAVALSQHGTVAPVTLHHRVDFAASMVDGKTIGEIDGKSKSAKEVSDLWAYIAARLARLVGVDAPRARTNLDVLSPLSGAEKFEAPVMVAAAPVEIEAEAEPEEDIEIAASADIDFEDDAPAEDEPIEDVMSAIRDGVSVAFSFDPSEGFPVVPQRLHAAHSIAPAPVPAWSPPPPPPQPLSPNAPRPPLSSSSLASEDRAEKALVHKPFSVFGRRRAESAPHALAEKHR
ncbi:MAG: AAA family ATPase [Parvibaculum sp.]|nr:AAA family ATPase [Parvibaculum sp.]